MTDEEKELQIGPSGYPGELEFIINLPNGDLFSLLSGLQQVDKSSIDWKAVPKIYETIAVEDGDKVWVPRIINDERVGILFVDMDEDKQDWHWIVLPSKLTDEGKWVSDSERAKTFKKIEYIDAVEYYSSLQPIQKPDEQ